MKQILLLLVMLPAIGFSQVLLSETAFKLGEIERLNEDVVDLNMVNQSDEDIFILRIESAINLDIKYTAKKLKPHTAELVRIKLNPQKTGKLKEEVAFYFSSNLRPIVLTISAEVTVIPKDNRQACPSFGANQLPQSNFQQFIRQQEVGEISAFFVELIPKEDYKDWEEAQDRKLIQKVEEHRAEETSVELTKNTTPLVTDGEKKTPEERRNAPSILETLFGNTEDSTAKAESSQKKVNDTDAPMSKLNPNTLDNSYKPNNIVFLIDASTSMQEEERMELLKKSMINLMESLREIDYLSIVTYSGEAEVLLPPTSGISKEAIRQSIENIVADGSTQAVKGIKKAIHTGSTSFIEGGNNQIILATDGAFNIGERNMSLRRKIEKTAENGLTITVLGIKNDRWTTKSLKEISDLGKGDLIRISGDRDAEKVLEEVKKRSKK